MGELLGQILKTQVVFLQQKTLRQVPCSEQLYKMGMPVELTPVQQQKLPSIQSLLLD
jgi:hypothetical protein